MSFSTGLSGLAAANTDLSVTGNNIANASTTGFKASRTEFGDAYTTSILGSGSGPVGGGVYVENVAQKFEQGNITSTGSSLDLAVDGSGFFVLGYENGQQSFTRSGIFGVDRDGFLVNNQGAFLQGYGLTDSGTVATGILQNMQVTSGSQPPRQTHSIMAAVNVSAGAQVLQQVGSATSTNGLAIGMAQVGEPEDTFTSLQGQNPPVNAALGQAHTFTSENPINAALFTAPGYDDDGVISITVNDSGTSYSGDIVPFSAGGITSVDQVVASINASINSDSTLAGKVRARIDPNNPNQIQMLTAGVFASNGASLVLQNGGGGNAFTDMQLNPANTATVTTPLVAPALFDNGTTMDLISVAGSPAAVQGALQSQLAFNNFEPGTNTVLTSGVVINDPVTLSANAAVFSFNMTTGYGLSPISINTTPSMSAADFETALNGALGTAFGNTAGVQNITAAINPASGKLEIEDNASTGPNPITITGALNTNTADFTTESLGLTNSGTTPRVLVSGDADTPANNIISITKIGAPSVTETLTIPALSYPSITSLVTALNEQIDVSANLRGLVVASEVNGRIQFSTVQEGTDDINGISVDFPNDANGATTTENALGFTSFTTLAPFDANDRSHSFRINLTVPQPDEDNRSGSVEISLNENIRSIEQLAAAINRELASAPDEDYIGVQAAVRVNENGDKVLDYTATKGGEGSVVSVSNIQATGADITEEELYGLLQVNQYDLSNLLTGEAGITNGYPAQSFVLRDEENDVDKTISIPEGAQANEIAELLGDLQGVQASASTQMRIISDDFVNAGDMTLYLNKQPLTANTLVEIVDEINTYSKTTLDGISAEIDEATGDLIIKNAIGTDLLMQIESETTTDQIVVQGVDGSAPVLLGGSASAETAARVGGEVEVILNEGFTMQDPSPRVAGLFNGLTENQFEDYILNQFNPDDPDSYNDTASMTTYDSLGNPHRVQLYYVKDPDDPLNPLALNTWTVYAQIDGENIGDPDPSLPYPNNLTPTIASHRMYFNADGTLDENATGDWLISNWDPVNEEGGSTGAYTSLNVAEGGGLPIPDPNTNSNFVIDMDGSTQYGGPFERHNFSQDGYSSGRLKDLEISDDGTIFARYTNGEAQVLGQLALASFVNNEGLTPTGHSEWAQSFDSGDPTIGEAGTGVLGSIRSASLEDSTVDLSEQLVHLIIAQRNYQANAKTIETANAVTQTIINLR